MITGLPQDWGKQRLHSWRAQTNLVHAKNQRKGAVIPQETEPKLPARFGGSPVEVRVSRGSPQGLGHGQQQSGKVLTLLEVAVNSTKALGRLGPKHYQGRSATPPISR